RHSFSVAHGSEFAGGGEPRSEPPGRGVLRGAAHSVRPGRGSTNPQLDLGSSGTAHGRFRAHVAEALRIGGPAAAADAAEEQEPHRSPLNRGRLVDDLFPLAGQPNPRAAPPRGFPPSRTFRSLISIWRTAHPRSGEMVPSPRATDRHSFRLPANMGGFDPAFAAGPKAAGSLLLVGLLLAGTLAVVRTPVGSAKTVGTSRAGRYR